MTRLCPPRIISHPQRVAMTGRLKSHDLIENIEHLLKFHMGEYEILRTTGYTHNPHALKRQLWRLGQHDLIARIFEHDQQHPNAARKAER